MDVDRDGGTEPAGPIETPVGKGEGKVPPRLTLGWGGVVTAILGRARKMVLWGVTGQEPRADTVITPLERPEASRRGRAQSGSHHLCAFGRHSQWPAAARREA